MEEFVIISKIEMENVNVQTFESVFIIKDHNFQNQFQCIVKLEVGVGFAQPAQGQ